MICNKIRYSQYPLLNITFKHQCNASTFTLNTQQIYKRKAVLNWSWLIASENPFLYIHFRNKSYTEHTVVKLGTLQSIIMHMMWCKNSIIWVEMYYGVNDRVHGTIIIFWNYEHKNKTKKSINWRLFKNLNS